MGRYILSPKIFNCLETIPVGAGNELQLTDAIAQLDEDVFALAYEGKRYDIGNRFGYLQAMIEYGLRNEEVGESLTKYLKSLDLDKF